MPQERFTRTTFERSRDAEYFRERELQTLTGQPASRFLDVILKELLDNALDACETARIAPALALHWAYEDEGPVRITVRDNGPGIPPETVERALHFHTYLSDKQAYRSPTRGAQGNALKTVVGIPYALGSREPLLIEARGVQHRITPKVDPAGQVHIRHETPRMPERPGTAITVTMPWDPWACKEALGKWAQAYALFNPHASVKICHGGHTGSACAYRPISRAEIFTNRRSSSPMPGANTCRQTRPRRGGIAWRI